MQLHRSLLSLVFFSAIAAVAIAQTPVPPVAGDVAVSEIMYNPHPDACVTDNDGEYFEVVNVSCKVLDLNGLCFEDRNTTTGLPSGIGFQVLPSVATLPPLYPGQRFLFARSAGGAFAAMTPNYIYGNATATPVDKSQVGPSVMNLNNSNVDGVFVLTGGFSSAAGVVIEAVSYNASVAPLSTVPNTAVSAERIDLYAAWTATATTNSNCAQALVGTTYGATGGTCLNTQRGTPGAANGNDATGLWLGTTLVNSVTYPNAGSMTIVGPVSLNSGQVKFKNDGGASLAGNAYAIGYSLPAVTEIPIESFILGNPGSLLLDLTYLDFIPGFTFDGTGADAPTVAVGNNPVLINLVLATQWLAVDGSLVIHLSNAVNFTVCP